MKKITSLFNSLRLIPLLFLGFGLFVPNTAYAGHCTASYVTDISAGIPACGTSGLFVGDCTGTSACEDYFDLTLTTGETVFLSFCTGGGTATWDTGLSVWSGAGFTTQEACNDDFCSVQSELTFVAPGNDTYRFRVGGFGGANGPYSLFVDLTAATSCAPVMGNVCYDIPRADTNLNTQCGTGDWYNGCAATLDLNWNDTTAGPINYVNIDFNIGVDCNGGPMNVLLNGIFQTTITPASFCACGTTPVPINLTLNAADYNQGGLNTLTIQAFTCLGLHDLGVDVYATVCAGASAPPVIVCPVDVTANTDAGVCGATVNFSDAVAIDPEDGVIATTQTMGLPSGSVFPVGVSTIEFSATDSDGNTATCTFTITVTDNEDPVVVCQDITVQLDANGMATIVPGDVVASSGDNCPTVTLDFLGPGAPGSLATLFARNNGGNFGGAVYFDVLVGPSDITINSIDVNSNEVGAMTIDVYTLVGTSVGNEQNPAPWGAPAATGNGTGLGLDVPSNMVLGASITLLAGTNYGMAIVMDATHGHDYTNGNGGNQFFSNADLSMSLGCANNTPFSSGPFCPRVFNGALHYTTGGSLLPSLDFDCADVGPQSVTVVATDESGNTSTCTATITVEDNIAPVIQCIGAPGSISDFQDFEGGSLPGGWSTVVVSGGFDWAFGSGNMPGGPDFPSNAAIFDDDAAGSGELDNTVELYSPIYDMTGATSATLSFDYSMQAFASSGELYVEVFDGGTWQQILFVDVDTPPTASGAIDVIGMANSAFQVRFRYDDENDWAWGAGVDNFLLDFSIPAIALEVDLDAMGMASINASDLLLSVTEACGWTATVDTTGAPEILPTLFAGGNGQAGNMFDIMAINDLTVDSFDISVDSGVTDDYEIYFKTGPYLPSVNTPGDWTMVASGNMTSAGDNVPTPLNLSLGINVSAGDTVAFYVTLVGTTAINYTNGTTTGALFTSDANMEFYEGAGLSYPFSSNFNPRIWNGNIHYSPGGGVSTTIDFTCADLGSNQIEVTVTDDSGNVATCTATVNVNDVTPPVLVCMDVTIELDENGMATIDPAALLAQAPGYYEVISISSDNQSGAVGETDFTVPVTMAEAVSFDWDYSTMDGPGFDSFGYLLNGVYTELTDPVGANNQNGSAAVAVAPGDVFGFRSSSTDGLFGPSTTVVSNFLPGFAGQFDPANWTLTLTNSDGDAFFVFFPGGPLSFDACGITILATDITEVDCDDIGSPIVITVFASDSSLNIAVCQSVVTVVDLLGPVVTCPADQTVDPGPGNLFWVIEDYFGTGAATATDNCTDPLTIFSQDPAPGTLLPDGVYTVTMSSTDEYGNVGVCTFELTVESILGVEDNKLDNAIGMYPNPALDRVTFTNTSGILLNQAVIHDMNGRQISTIDLRDMQQEKTVDVSNLSSGVYMVQFQSDDASTVKRLVKE